MRHGEALSNVEEIVSCWPEKFENHLTEKGRKTIKKSAENLKGESIDLIFSSDLLRAKQTAEITGKVLGVKPEFDKRLREIGFGIFNGKPIEKLWHYFKKEEERIKKRPPKGETYSEILKRVYRFLKDTGKKYRGKNILIISHEGPLTLLEGKVKGLSLARTIKTFPYGDRIHKGQIKELN